MSAPTPTAGRRMDREKRTVEAMIRMLCCDVHGSRGDALCAECTELLAYAMARLDRCRFGEDKPKCAACPVHCYKPEMREKIQTVMRHSGPRMMLRHPVLAAGHVMDGVLHPPRRPGKKSAS